MRNIQGKVILAGAGPGDPELISVKAARVLQLADIVLTDRLVSAELLNEYVPPHAEIIYVGKQGRHKLSTPQKTINRLMVEHARAGKVVVRLKGGDVSIFSNILDELQALCEQGVPYEIIPGISAASGAAAYAGIPLTARNYARSVRFVTAHANDTLPANYWKDLARTEDTLVFYMSTENIEVVVNSLTLQGISSDKFIAVVEQATTRAQNVYVSNIYTCLKEFEAISFTTPSLLIIGKVVALHEQFAWIRNSYSHEQYFEPLDQYKKQVV
ncbi:MAG TPA: uroporphyrinogen-III C-methyltransferase [Chitinophagaceae bacterium]|nr:uroporphyrinogen-III C-methyltransferase [Chitinophagaceae bacterium]